MIHIHTDSDKNTIIVDTDWNGRLVVSEQNGKFYLHNELQEDPNGYVIVDEFGGRKDYTHNELLEEIDAVSVFSTDDLTLLIEKLGEMRDEAIRVNR